MKSHKPLNKWFLVLSTWSYTCNLYAFITLPGSLTLLLVTKREKNTKHYRPEDKLTNVILDQQQLYLVREAAEFKVKRGLRGKNKIKERARELMLCPCGMLLAHEVETETGNPPHAKLERKGFSLPSW